MQFFKITLIFAWLLSCNCLPAQDRSVKGRVTDLADGHPVIYAKVEVGKNVTITDDEGRFSITAEPGDRLIRFSAIGYHNITLVIPDSIDSEMAITLREHVHLDFWNRPLAQKRYFSYSPYVSLDLPDVYRIKVHTRRVVPKKKLQRLVYGDQPYYAPFTILFEDKGGNPVHQDDSKMIAKRLKSIPSDIIEFKGFVPVWADNSSAAPVYCYEQETINSSLCPDENGIWNGAIPYHEASVHPGFGDPSNHFAYNFSTWTSQNIWPDGFESTRDFSELRCRVKFIIEEDGSIGKIKIIEPSALEAYDNEVIRTISESPSWTPAHDSYGNAIKSYVVMPFFASFLKDEERIMTK